MFNVPELKWPSPSQFMPFAPVPLVVTVSLPPFTVTRLSALIPAAPVSSLSTSPAALVDVIVTLPSVMRNSPSVVMPFFPVPATVMSTEPLSIKTLSLPLSPCPDLEFMLIVGLPVILI